MNNGDDLLAQAKLRLPLSTLMAQLGLGDRAKKSALCPFHEDSSPSFGLYRGDDGEEFWKCFAGCGGGDAIDFLAKHHRLCNADACREYIRLAGVSLAPAPDLNGKPSTATQPRFDWQRCVAAVTPVHRNDLGDCRGYSPTFVEWLHAQKLIGRFDGEHIAFPVHDAQGNSIGCHYRRKAERSWRYFPTGTHAVPLIIGDIGTAKIVFAFESQWDLLAVLDCLHHHIQPLAGTAAIATRGASNGRLLAGLFPDAVVYAFGQNDKAGQNWLADVATNCGRKTFHVVTPSPHKDVNDWTRADATADEIRRAIAEAQPLPAPVIPDLHSAPTRNAFIASTPATDDTEEPPPKAFPLDSLPPIAAGIVKEVARVERNPPILAACAALATLSAAIGSGLEVVSGPNRTTSGNLYILGSAQSGAGKSRAYDLICKPFLDAQRENITKWAKEVEPDLKAEIAVVSQRIEQLKGQARKAESDDERAHQRAELKFPLAQLDELTKKLHMPRWSTEDVTIEALADLLDQNHEVIFSMSADGRKVADNLLGRMNPNKRVDDSLYLKGFTRDGCTVDRKDMLPTILNHPWIGIFWLIQPDILDDLVAERSLMLGGFLPRALICHTRTKRQKIEGCSAAISEVGMADWCRLIVELLATYHQPSVHYVIQCSEPALQRFNAHYNLTVDQGNELADVESFVARWTEQAWHLAVVLHACLWGKIAHNHTLSLETAEAAIAIADWFAGQQLAVLARGLHEARRKIENRVLEVLDDRWERLKLDYITPREILRVHITRDADEARGLLGRMETGGVLLSEEVRRPEGGHVERRYRLKTGRNPVPT